MSEQSVFLAALDIADPAERAEYLRRACGGDAALQRRVTALLAAHERSGEFLAVPALRQIAAADVPAEASAGAAPPAERSTNAAGAESETAAGPPGLPKEIDLSFLQPSSKPGSLGRLGHYEIEAVLGAGGCGVVLKAFDEKLRRLVAVKVMNSELATTSPARKRFLREARAAAAVRHANVIGIHAVEDRPVPFLVMEHIDGETLQQKLNRTGPLEVPDILRIGRLIAEGLAAAHAKGLLHRDIKPANILLEAGKEWVKITDFGLARSADDASVTRSGVIAGTPLYMSPEQAKGRRIDQRSDLFSLGSVLYVMCSGRPPFRAPTILAVLKRVAEDQPRPIGEIIPEAPEWLIAIIAKLHAKNSADRFDSAQKVADLLGKCHAELERSGHVDALKDILPPLPPKPQTTPTGESDRPPTDSPADSPTDPPAARARLPRWVAALLAVVMLLCGVGLGEATGVTDIRGTVIRLLTPDGTLVVEVDDPGVSVSIDGQEIVITGAGVKEIRLEPGQYKVLARKDGQLVRQELVTVTKNGRRVVRISREPKPRAAPTASAPEASQDGLTAEWNRRIRDNVLPLGDGKVVLSEHARLMNVIRKDDKLKLFFFLTEMGQELQFINLVGARCVYQPNEWAAKAFSVQAPFFEEKFIRRGILTLEVEVRSPLAPRATDGPAVPDTPGVRPKPADTVVVRNEVFRDQVFRGHASPVTAVLFTPDGSRVVTASNGDHHEIRGGVRYHVVGADNSVRVWDAGSAREIRRFRMTEAHGYGPRGMGLSPDGRLLAVSSGWIWANGPSEPRIEVWELDSGRRRHHLTFDGNAAIRGVGMSSDGSRLFAFRDGGIHCWSLPEGQALSRNYLEGSPHLEAPEMNWSPGCRYLLSPSWDGGSEFIAWDGLTGEVAKTFRGHDRPVAEVVMSPDGQRLLSCAEDRSIRLWDWSSGKEILRVDDLASRPSCVAFSPDAARFLAGSADGTIRLYETATGGEIARFEGHAGTVRDVAFSPSGLNAASAGDDQTARLWALPRGRTASDGEETGPAGDADRRAAEYVLSIGGKVRVDDPESRGWWSGWNELSGWDDGAISDARNLPVAPFQLTDINLKGNRDITDRDLALFQHTRNLRVIQMEFVPGLTDAGIAYFQDNQNLAALDLWETNVSAAGLELFKKHSSIRDLRFGYISLTDEEMIFFRDFASLPNLTCLMLSGTAIGDDGVAYLSGATHLLQLNLDDTRITDAGLLHLRPCRSLLYLHVKNTRVTAAGVAALRQALPHCQVFWNGADEPTPDPAPDAAPDPDPKPAKAERPDPKAGEGS